jgi:pimeloyl-ACP methyl ester carboxylesterase
LLFSADVYGGFYKDLQEMSGDKAQVIPFVYDWRQDLPQAAAKLSDLVDQLLGAGVSQVDIVAHSMGGMVASYYLAYGNQEPKEAKLTWQGAQKIRKFLVMGTPFQGVFSVFRNMQKGAPLGGNRTLLPPEAVASFPASYQLMPLQNPHVLNLENQIQKLPLAEIETWQDRKLGLLRRQDLGEEVHGRRENFLRSQLARAQKFSDLLQLKDPSVPKPDHLKVMNVIGEGHLVAETALYDAEQKLFIFDVDDPKSWGFSENNFWSEGDGTVSITSATLPKGLAPGALVFRTRAGHTELWRDPVLQKEIQKFLVLY